MPRTPDRFPGNRQEEEIQMEDTGADPASAGGITYNAGSFSFKDATGLFDPRTGGSGLSAAAHRVLDQLAHVIAEDSYEEYTYSGSKVTNITVWTDNGKTTKIREVQFTYSGNLIDEIVTIQYDGAGAVVSGETMTESFTYSGNQVTEIDRVMS